ncbi:MAG: MFS transporter [Promethearchaeota archaeon]
MRRIKSSSSQLIILLLARIAFDLDFQSITLYFSTLSESYNVQIWLMGFLVSVYSISILLSPIFGNLSDQYGRKRFLTIGLILFGISSWFMVITQNWFQIILARAFTGLSSAIFLPSLLAQLGDNYSYEKRSRAMGLVRLSWPITFIFGVPLVGYSIEHLNWRIPFIILGFLAVITCVLIIFMDSPISEISNQPTMKKSIDLFKTVLLNRNALSGLLLTFFAVGAIQGIFAFFPVWMETTFQIEETYIGIVLSFMGIGTLFGTLLATWFGDKIGPKQCSISGLIVAACCMVLLSNFSFNISFVIVWLILLGTAFDFSMTEVPVLLTQVSSGSKGTVLSFNQALNAGASALGSALSGIIWISFGYGTIGVLFAITAFTGALIGYFNIKVVPEQSFERN